MLWQLCSWVAHCPDAVLWCSVHTLEAPVVGDIADLYRGIDGGACAALLAKLAVEKSYVDKMDETRNALQVSLLLDVFMHWSQCAVSALPAYPSADAVK